MTISTTTAKSRYAGDGSTTSFPTGFKFLDGDHVRVLLRAADGSETLWSEGSEYSLSGAGAPGGGTVEVIISPTDHTPAAGETLVVKLAVPPRQETSLPLGGAFPSTAVEAMADLAALRDQQIEEALSRAVKFAETTALADVTFPEPEAGKPVGWSAEGDALINLEAVGRWQGDWAPATGYVALDVVREPISKNIYVCEMAHTAGSFAMDLAAGKWSLAINVEDAEAAVAAAEAAQAAAASSALAAVGSASAASTSASEAAASATVAATSATDAGNSATTSAAGAITAAAAATAAQTAETNAETAEAIAQSAQAAAETAQAAAETARAAAESAGTSAETAVADALAIYGSMSAISSAVAEAQAAESAAEAAETTAEAAAANATSSASAASASAGNAASSASAAAISATAAQAAESNAETAETNAETAAAGAAASASAAAASAAQVEATKLIWRGDWSGVTAYAVNDAVAHDGASWICSQAHTDQEPPDPSYWDILAAKGTQGDQGLQGIQGEQGDPGVAIVAKGAYSAGTAYAEDDGVTYQGSFWRSLQNANQGNTPDSSPTFWEETVERGDTGPAADTVIMLAVGDEATAIEAGTGKLTFRMPMAFTLSAVRASLKTASSSGAVTVDINEVGATILSTKLTIDQGETTSTTAATPAVISDSALADDAEITVDIDGAGTGAVGLKVTLIGVPA